MLKRRLTTKLTPVNRTVRPANAAAAMGNSRGVAGVLPTLDLRFLNGVLPSGITFTRASSGRYFDSTGRLATQGYNLLTYSEDLSNAAWTKTAAGTGTVPVVTGGFPAPDGTNTAWRVQLDKGAGATSTDQSQISANSDASLGGAAKMGVWLRLNSGTTANVFMCIGSTKVCTVTTAWQFFKTDASTVTNARIGVRGTFGTSDAADLLIWHPQAENAAELGTYSPTATAANGGPRFDYDPATPAGTVGAELVTNGDFSQGTSGWSEAGAGYWSIENGIATSTNPNASVAYLDHTPSYASITTGKTYLVEFDWTGGSGTIYLRGGTGTAVSGAGRKSFNYVAGTSVAGYGFRVGTASIGTFTIDNISVKEVTFTPRGLLIEEQRTNLLLHSRDMTQAAWTKTDVTATRNQVGIDGTANSACLMTVGSTLTEVVSQNATVTAGSTITFSQVFKRGNTDWVRLQAVAAGGADGVDAWFNLNTGAKGTVSARGAGTNNSSTITNLGGGWYRLSVTSTPNGTYTTAIGLWVSAAGDGNIARVPNATYIVDAAQLEVGAFATSIITTGAATATRAADSASMTGANFSSWYNQTQGTFVAEFRRFGFDGVVGAVAICQADDGTANNRVALRLNTRQTTGQAQQTIAVAGVVNLNEGQGPITSIDGLNVKVVIAYQVGVGATGRDGTVANATSNPSLPTVTQFNIGQGPGGVHLNGWMRRISHYPVRQPNATASALTS